MTYAEYGVGGNLLLLLEKPCVYFFSGWHFPASAQDEHEQPQVVPPFLRFLTMLVTANATSATTAAQTIIVPKLAIIHVMLYASFKSSRLFTR